MGMNNGLILAALSGLGIYVNIIKADYANVVIIIIVSYHVTWELYLGVFALFSASYQ